MRAVLFPNIRDERALECTINTCTTLIKLGFEVGADDKFSSMLGKIEGITLKSFEVLAEKADVIIAIGGDGTILHCSKTASRFDVPLLGINTGRLGFMASLEPHELEKLSLLKSGEYTCIRRMMLDITVQGNTFTALNDAVITKQPMAKLPDFTVCSNGTAVSSLRADGLIFSTPTGSTAYSLSAGGPIIEPELECIEFSQICAHTLFARTMLFSTSKLLSVTFKSDPKQSVSVSIDGEPPIAFHEHEELLVQKSNRYVDIIDISGNSFYSAVNNKLMQPMK